MARSVTDLRLSRVLSVIAILLAVGALIVPLPLGLAAALLAGWAIWRAPSGARFPLVALGFAVLGTAGGIMIGLAITRFP